MALPTNVAPRLLDGRLALVTGAGYVTGATLAVDRGFLAV